MNSLLQKKQEQKMSRNIREFLSQIFAKEILSKATSFSFVALVTFYPLFAHAATAVSFSDVLNKLTKFGGFIQNIIFGIPFNAVASVIFGIAGALLSVAVGIFDVAIEFSLDSANLQIDGLTTAWTVLRDVANMSFIAVLVYIAFLTILQAESTNTKSLLVNLIIMALLINFSYFLAGIVIDASNILAGIFYNKMALDANDHPRSIAGIFEQALRLSTMVDAQTLDAMDYTQAGAARLLGSVMLFIAAFTFLSGAILFVLRTVVLMFALALSPLAFAAAILPATKKYWEQWLHYLINHAFVAPAYLLLIYVITLIIQSKGFVVLNTSDGTFTYREVGKVFLNYILFIGLLLGAYTVAKNMASDIAGMSVKWAGKATGAGFGLAAFAGRRFGGRGFGALARSEFLKNLGFKFEKDAEGNILSAKAKSGFGGFLARQALKGSEGVAKSSFDVRAGKIGGVLGATGVGFGTAGGRGGFEAIRKEQINKEMALAKSLGETTFSRKEYEEVGQLKTSIPIEKKNVAEAEKAVAEAKTKENAALQKLEQLPKDISAQEEKLTEARGAGDKAKETAVLKQLEKLNQSVLDENKKLTEAQTDESKAKAEEVAALQKLAPQQQRLDALEGRGKVRAGAYAEKVVEERFFPLMDPKTKREVASKIKAELGKSPELKLQEQLAATLKQLAEKQ